MITLYPVPDISRFRPGRPPAASRKVEDLTVSTSQQARIEARRILLAGLSPQVWRILDFLSVGGVFSVKRFSSFGVSERTLQRLAQMRIAERLVHDGNDLRQGFGIFGLDDDPHPVLYTLGPVGIEIATLRHDVPPPTGYQGYTLSRILHDVITNEIVFRLAAILGQQGWTVEWLGKYEALIPVTITIKDKEKDKEYAKQVSLEPDALIRFHNDKEERAFLLEYHNEDKGTRAMYKVEKYEAAFDGRDWRERWEVETFPPVLAVFWQKIVGAGYQSVLAGKRPKCVYYGKTLEVALEGKLDEWINIATNQREIILPKER